MYPKPYIDYLIEFHAKRDFFECHEILEEHWKKTGMNDKTWVGLIQIAVGLYHQRRNNHNGALKMFKNALKLVSENKENIINLGLDEKKLIKILEKRVEKVINKESYTDINLPFRDFVLENECLLLCKNKKLKWCEPSDMNDHYLLNKHSLREK